jgi:alkyl hydroperoxide reductase subunit AhpF
VTLAQAGEMSADEKQGKIVRGVFADRDIPEYTQLYDQIIERVQRGAA